MSKKSIQVRPASNRPKKPSVKKASNVTFPFFMKTATGKVGAAPKSIQKKVSSVPHKTNQKPTVKRATKTKRPAKF